MDDLVETEVVVEGNSEDRLEELATLEEGWLDGRGDAISTHLIQLVRDRLLGLEGMPKPLLYPTPEGGIIVEWTFLEEGKEKSWIEIEFSRVTYPSGVRGTEAYLSVENALKKDGDVRKVLDALAS